MRIGIMDRKKKERVNRRVGKKMIRRKGDLEREIGKNFRKKGVMKKIEMNDIIKM